MECVWLLCACARACVVEWGAQIVPTNVDISDSCSAGNSSAFCAANTLYREQFEPGALAGAGGPGTLDVLPVGYITPGLILMDALHGSYQDWIVAMARRMVAELPVAGIAWDRSDHAQLLNGRLDDGIAFDRDAGNVTSWLGTGWQQVVSRVCEVFHAAHKACIHNTYTNRLDFNRHMDGIYDENGDQSWRAPVDALLGLSKPVWLWDHCGSQERDVQVARCSRDVDETHAWLASTFYYGAQATSPFPPCGDHTITSTNIASGSLQVYKDFAPLWPLLRHKRWILLPRAVEVNDSRISAANIFSMTVSGGGLVVPVLNAHGPGGWGQLARQNATIAVSISQAALRETEAGSCEVRYPGGRDTVELVGLRTSSWEPAGDGARVFDVTLRKGFAVLVCPAASGGTQTYE